MAQSLGQIEQVGMLAQPRCGGQDPRGKERGDDDREEAYQASAKRRVGLQGVMGKEVADDRQCDAAGAHQQNALPGAEIERHQHHDDVEHRNRDIQGRDRVDDENSQRQGAGGKRKNARGGPARECYRIANGGRRPQALIPAARRVELRGHFLDRSWSWCLSPELGLYRPNRGSGYKPLFKYVNSPKCIGL